MEDLVTFGGATFVMGDDTVLSAREAPAHVAEIGPFGLGRCCVTAGEYFDYVKSTSGFDETWCDYIDPCFIIRTGMGFELRPGAGRFPMVQVSYWGCAAYCNWLSVSRGLTPVYDLAAGAGDPGRNGYRLPLEAEWEFACLRGLGHRAGRDATPGDEAAGTVDERWAVAEGIVNHRDAVLADGHHRASERLIGGFAFPAWSPVEAGTFPADRAGLHEMLGNVREWCHDRYTHYQPGRQHQPMGGDRGYYRVVRGGSFMDAVEVCRPRARAAVHQDNKCMQYGFRIARTLT